MKNFIVNFTNDITLTYKLVNHNIVDKWSNLIMSKSINDCCERNHYCGYASEELFQSRLNKLYYLADLINEHVPANKIQKIEITEENSAEALSIMHVHFPELKNDSKYSVIWEALSEYNDTIHWLETVFKSKRYANLLTKSSFFKINLDFNKNENLERISIPENAYELFTPYTNFGYLMLHYVHIGRHAHELFGANDLICPKDQFVPQRQFTASTSMYFQDNFHDTEEKKQKLLDRWKNFYYLRGKEFWDYDMEDPKIAFGYMKIGELTSIKNDTIPHNSSDMHIFREKLSNSKLIDWKVVNEVHK